jgi:hypothetical protein
VAAFCGRLAATFFAAFREAFTGAFFVAVFLEAFLGAGACWALALAASALTLAHRLRVAYLGGPTRARGCRACRKY